MICFGVHDGIRFLNGEGGGDELTATTALSFQSLHGYDDTAIAPLLMILLLERRLCDMRVVQLQYERSLCTDF